MVVEKNECCYCESSGYPCLGSSCPNKAVKHLICDKCREEVDDLYEYGDKQLCVKCLLLNFTKIE